MLPWTRYSEVDTRGIVFCQNLGISFLENFEFRWEFDSETLAQHRNFWDHKVCGSRNSAGGSPVDLRGKGPEMVCNAKFASAAKSLSPPGTGWCERDDDVKAKAVIKAAQTTVVDFLFLFSTPGIRRTLLSSRPLERIWGISEIGRHTNTMDQLDHRCKTAKTANIYTGCRRSRWNPSIITWIITWITIWITTWITDSK